MFERVAKLKRGLTGLQSLAHGLSYVSPTSPNTPSNSSKTNVGLLEEPKEYPPYAVANAPGGVTKVLLHTYPYLDLS